MHAADALEDVAERTVTQIVNQRCGETQKLIFLGDVERAAKLLDDFSRRLHHAKAVAVAGMVSPGISERRHAELADATQALELDAVEQAEEEGIDSAVEPERDHVVHRIADDLLTDRHQPDMLRRRGSDAQTIRIGEHEGMKIRRNTKENDQDPSSRASLCL